MTLSAAERVPEVEVPKVGETEPEVDGDAPNESDAVNEKS